MIIKANDDSMLGLTVGSSQDKIFTCATRKNVKNYYVASPHYSMGK